MAPYSEDLESAELPALRLAAWSQILAGSI